MLRIGLVAVVVGLVFAAPADGWVEGRALELPAGASCLRAAGPGEVTVLGELRARTSATDLLAVGAEAIERRGSVTLGWLVDCAEAGGAPGVAPLLAGPVLRGKGRRRTPRLRAAVPGSRPFGLAADRRAGAGLVAVAVARGGAAVVAWVEDARGGDGPNRLVAAVRPAGARRFGRPQVIGRGVLEWDEAPVVAVDPAGRAHVGWIGEGGPEFAGDDEQDAVVRVASAAPRRRFAAPQDLGRTWGNRMALAASIDGGALVVALLRGDTRAWERRPGQRRFRRIALPHIAADEPAVALAPGGAAVLAYRNSGGVDVLRRQPGGAFGAAQEVFPSDEGPTSQAWSTPFWGSRPQRPPDSFAGEIAVRLAGDGAIVVAWVDAADEQGTTEPPSAHAAHGTLAGGFPEPAARLGGACRSANATAPVELPDGRLAVAWTDNADVSRTDGEDLIAGGGQVHVARPGAAAGTPLPPVAPVLEAELIDRRVGVGRPLRLRVRCAGGPCDVRAVARSQRIGAAFSIDLVDEPEPVAISTTLAAGEVTELRLDPAGGYAFGRAGTRAPVPIVVTACTPSGPVAQSMELREPVEVPQVAPLPRAVGLRARALPGGAVRVTWRTLRPAGPGTGFMVLDDDPSGDGPVAGTLVPGRGRSRFAVTLRPRDKPIRRVQVVLHTRLSDTADFAEARVR